MIRFVTFVDGSNLDVVLKHLNLRVDDYGSFYRYLFDQASAHWGRTFSDRAPVPPTRHARIYWYVVGKMDDWDLGDPKAINRLRSRFEMNPRLRDIYADEVARRMPDVPPEDRIDQAWQFCLNETREWYDGKRRALDRKKRFYHGVQSTTDFIEIRQEGHWRVDLLNHSLNEKGLEASMAVDMVALADIYDIALMITGEGESIPGVPYVKAKAKHVGVVEFRRGTAADSQGKGSSSRLKIAADFIVYVYEGDLIRHNLAYRSEGAYSDDRYGHENGSNY